MAVQRRVVLRRLREDLQPGFLDQLLRARAVAHESDGDPAGEGLVGEEAAKVHGRGPLA